MTPTSGELTPAGTEGTLIKVAYKPQIYGKAHKAKLVVQVRQRNDLSDHLAMQVRK